MADKTDQREALEQGVPAWNAWRRANPRIRPNLVGVDLSGADLRGANLAAAELVMAPLAGANLCVADLGGADLTEANLAGANLARANLCQANLTGTDLSGADLSGVDLVEANLDGANLSEARLGEADLSAAKLTGGLLIGADLRRASLAGADLGDADLIEADLRAARLPAANLVSANLARANLGGADLSGATLIGANLSGASLHQTDLTGANLVGANLAAAALVGTNLERADLRACRVHGLCAWNLNLDAAVQDELVISDDGDPPVSVDGLALAQLVAQLLYHRELGDLVEAAVSRGVLLLGRFGERVQLLKGLRRRLRELGFVPLVFDFKTPTGTDFAEISARLAGLTTFTIADITAPDSSSQMAAETLPEGLAPLQPILERGAEPCAALADLDQRYTWALPTFVYETPEHLLDSLQTVVVEPALRQMAGGSRPAPPGPTRA